MKLHSWVIGNKLHFESSENINEIKLLIKKFDGEVIYGNTFSINKNVDYWFQPDNSIDNFEKVIVEVRDKNSEIIFNEIIPTKYIPVEIKHKVYYVLPWDSNKNIGKYLNDLMSKLDDSEWLCIMDSDAMHTTTYFGKRIEEVIDKNPEYSLFTCYTNRVGCPWQIAPNSDWNSDDISYHRTIGEKLWTDNGTTVVDVTNNSLLSGIMFLLTKKTWNVIKNFTENMLHGFDNNVHDKIIRSGLKVGLMSGIYLYHWYRGGSKTDKFHILNSNVITNQ
jgi:hypothetical protein